MRRAVAEPLETRQLLAAVDPIIMEFMADNVTGIRDADTDRSDWIEIYNPDTVAVNLAGWHLTDDPANLSEWTFPSQPLAAGGYLVVWASGKNRAVVGQQLHTNFQLDSAGEYLALVKPDGVTKTTEFDQYPPQIPDVSYGYAPGQTASYTYLTYGAPGKVRVPSDSSLGATWIDPAYDDSLWSAATTGIGFQAAGGNAPRPAEVEPNGTTAQANSAVCNFNTTWNSNVYQLAITGTQTTNDDWFKIGSFDVGDIITITEAGSPSRNGATLTDGAIELVRSTGSAVVASDDNSGPGNDALIYRFTVAAADTYYIHAKKGATSPANGTYQIGAMLENTGALPLTSSTTTSETESNDTLATANDLSSSWRQINYQSHTTGNLTAGDADIYSFTLTGGSTLSVRATSTSSVDAKVSVLNSSGTAIAFDDGTSVSTAPNDSFIDGFILPGSGAQTFYIKVEPASGTGTYALDLQYSSTTAPPSPTSFSTLVNTDMTSAMKNVNASAYVRIPFTVADASVIGQLVLRMKYDDGFIAYINGVQVAARNAPASPVFNSTATVTYPDTLSPVFNDIDITAFRTVLQSGTNILAVQELNITASDADSFIMPEIDAISLPLGPLSYMTTPTPGAANIGGALGYVADTHFSEDRGYYTAPFDVVISTATAGAQVRYTLDGSLPTATTGNIYTGPVHISTTSVLRAAGFKAGYVATNVDTVTYIFIADVIHQSNTPAGFPSSWGYYDAGNTQPTIADYAMDPEIVNTTTYQNRIIPAMESVPTLSIVMPIADLFSNTLPAGINSGIYSFPLQADADNAVNPIWERAGSIEYFDPATGQEFQINGGVQMQGGGSRDPGNTPKHSFRLLFKSRYGDPKLHFPLFDDSSVDSFDALILKAQYNNTWVHWDPAQRARGQNAQDSWASDTEVAMGKVTKHDKYVQLYLNGLYWGVYQLQERPESSWAASYFGGNDVDYDVVDNTAALIDGNITAWNTMFSIANAGLVSDAAYQSIQQYLNIPDFIKYMILNLYDANQDWDDHNWYAVRRSRVNGSATNIDGFHFISFDSERILEDPTQNLLSLNHDQRPTRLFQQLRANAEFRQLFADYVHQFFFNNGALTPGAAADRYRAELAKIDPAIIAESARWGDYRRDVRVAGAANLYSRDTDWLTEANYLLGTYFPVRSYNFLNQLRAANLYPSIEAPEFSKLGGDVSAGFSLAMANLSGQAIYYTTNGTDPRLSGGTINPQALVWSGPLTLNTSARIQARVYNAATATWSALSDATFNVTPAPALHISEVMYHPQKPAGSTYTDDDYQFLELVNTGSTLINLAGIRVTGIGNFTFSSGTLAAGARTVLVYNLTAFQQRYGTGVPVAGVYTGTLDHGGETITLYTPTGGIIEQFGYNDGWYPQTDGEGFSLVAVDPAASNATLNTQAGWRASTTSIGAPGAADPGYNNNVVVINEVLVAATSPAVPFIELKNTTPDAIDISGWFLSNASSNLQKYTIPGGTIISGNSYLALYLTAYGAAFTPKSTGDQIYLSSDASAGVLGGYHDSVDFGPAITDVPFGRYIKSTGASDFTALTAATPGAANASPAVGPVVINEIMYWPTQAKDEFIEIKNISAAAVALHDGTNGWKFTDGVSYAFTAGATLAAGEVALVVGMDPATFRSRYSIPAGVQIFGPYDGQLSNNGENLELSRPQVVVVSPPFVVVDRVHYDIAADWPAAADHQGSSLQRTNPSAYGNDSANWSAAITGGTIGAAKPIGGTPGAANSTRTPPAIAAINPAVMNEAGTLTLTGSFTDPDAGESWTGQILWGDNWASQSFTPNANKTFTLSHFYADSGAFTAKVIITDSSGLASTVSVPVTVNNLNPTAFASGPGVPEGSAGSVSVTSRNDASSIDLSVAGLYSYDFNNDGVFEITDSTASSAAIPASYLSDGPATVTVRVRVFDKDYGYTDAPASIFVISVAPSAVFSNGGAVNEGSPGTVTFSSQTDPSPADQAAGFRYSYDFDNNGIFEIVDSTSASVTVPGSYLSDGPLRTIRGQIKDKDVATRDITTSIVVNNVAPTVLSVPALTVGIGYPLAFSGAFTDPGADTWTAGLTPGDGSGAQALTVNPDKTVTGSVIYQTPGTYTASLSVTDKDGGVGTQTFQVTVRGPSISGSTDYLRLDSTGTYVEFYENGSPSGQPTFLISQSAISTISVTGTGSGGQLTVDLANGNPLPAGGTTYAGGAGTDSLVLANVPATAAVSCDESQVIVNGRSVVLTSAETVTLAAATVGSLAISGGATLSVPSLAGRVFSTAELSITGSAVLDVADNDIVVSYPGASPLIPLCGWVANGRIGIGPRIVGTVAAPPADMTFGMVDNNMLHLAAWQGQSIAQGSNFNQVILKRTYVGDTNLDGQVTEADCANVIANQGHSGGWFEGDVNYDGIITADDLAAIRSHMGSGVPSEFGPSLLAAPQLVQAAPKVAAKVAAKKKPAHHKPAAPRRPLLVKSPAKTRHGTNASASKP